MFRYFLNRLRPAGIIPFCKNGKQARQQKIHRHIQGLRLQGRFVLIGKTYLLPDHLNNFMDQVGRAANGQEPAIQFVRGQDMERRFASKRDLIRAFAGAMNLISPEVENHHEKVSFLAYRLADILGIVFVRYRRCGDN